MDPLSSPSNINGSSTHADTLRNKVNSVDEHENPKSSRWLDWFSKEFECIKRGCQRDPNDGSISSAKFRTKRVKKGKMEEQVVETVCLFSHYRVAGCSACGFNMSWTAITAALALVVLDFKDATPCLEKWKASTKPESQAPLWDFMEPYAKIDHVSGIAVLAIVILVLSNFASNVPTASAAAISASEEKKAWLILAWVSTVAGNLSLFGISGELD
ncbi:hypothetical protein V6N13_021686 [Hibiscus sabdariffa]